MTRTTIHGPNLPAILGAAAGLMRLSDVPEAEIGEMVARVLGCRSDLGAIEVVREWFEVVIMEEARALDPCEDCKKRPRMHRTILLCQECWDERGRNEPPWTSAWEALRQ